MKKIILGSLLALCIAVPALAHPPITVYVDQQKVAFADQAPVIVDDRTLVPMRKIFEAMDADVTWDEPSQTITSTRGSDVVTMTIGQKQVYKNGKVVYEPYRIKVLNTINFKKSMHYNPFAYARHEVA